MRFIADHRVLAHEAFYCLRVVNVWTKLKFSLLLLDGLCLLTGRRGERRDGKSKAGQQEDPFQPSARSRRTTLLNVKPQEHGEPCLIERQAGRR